MPTGLAAGAALVSGVWLGGLLLGTRARPFRLPALPWRVFDPVPPGGLRRRRNLPFAENPAMKNPAWIRTLLAISLALNLGVVAALVLRPAPDTVEGGAPPVVHLPEYLKPTQQRARWEGMETPFLHDLSSNWSDIRRHREALVRHIFADAPERTAIDAEQAAIARLQAAATARD